MKWNCFLGFHVWRVKTRTIVTEYRIHVTTYNRCNRPGCRYHDWRAVDVEQRPRPTGAQVGKETWT